MSKATGPIMRLIAEVENQRPQRINGALVDGAVMELTALRSRAEQADALAGAVGEFVDTYEKAGENDVVGMLLVVAAYEKLVTALAAYKGQA